MDLQHTVENFARLTLNLADADLERPWNWEEYDEGVRFAFFRTYEELRELAVELRSQRQQMARPQSMAQHQLAQYHAAYQDLRAVVLGVDDELALRPPAEGEWSLRDTLVHVIRTERAFFAVTHYAVERVRAQARGEPERPLALPDEGWDAFWKAANDRFDTLREDGPFLALLDYYDQLHQRVLTYFASLTDRQLEAPAVYWESTPMEVAFRLHRFDSHLRQHTIQIGKSLHLLVGPPNEARRLLRLIYAALAEVQGIAIVDPGSGVAGFGSVLCEKLSEEIGRRVEEIADVLEDQE